MTQGNTSMNMGGGQMNQGNNSMMMSGQASIMGNNGMAMLNQMQQQQQQQAQANSMNLNMMQQHNLLRQQQHQQNTMGINMMQQNPNAATMIRNNASLMGNNGMTMINMNLQSVIPGPTNGGGIGNMPVMSLTNHSGMGSRDSITMPPPGVLNVPTGVAQMQSVLSDDLNSMSPDRFVGNDFPWWSGS